MGHILYSLACSVCIDDTVLYLCGKTSVAYSIDIRYILYLHLLYYKDLWHILYIFLKHSLHLLSFIYSYGIILYISSRVYKSFGVYYTSHSIHLWSIIYNCDILYTSLVTLFTCGIVCTSVVLSVQWTPTPSPLLTSRLPWPRATSSHPARPVARLAMLHYSTQSCGYIPLAWPSRFSFSRISPPNYPTICMLNPPPPPSKTYPNGSGNELSALFVHLSKRQPLWIKL